MRATAAVTASLIGGRVALSRIRSDPPLAIRRTGPARVHVVGTAAGPMPGDDLRLDVVVRAGAQLTVCASAATVALPGAGGVQRPSQLHVRAVVEDGAQLCLWPHPTVAAAGCNHVSRTTIEMAADSRLLLREQLVGGRSCDGESGRLRAELLVDRASEPVLHQTLSIGPGVAFGSTYGRPRCVGTLLVVDASDSGWRADGMDFPAPDTVVCALAARGGWLASALSADAATLRSQLGAARDHLVHQTREMITVP
jgi:urease accessory protein